MATLNNFLEIYQPALVQIAAAVLFFAVLGVFLYLGFAVVKWFKQRNEF